MTPAPNTINTICFQICLPRLCGSVLFISDEFSRLFNTFRYPLGNFLKNICIYNTKFSAPKNMFENWLRGVSKTHRMKRNTPEMNVSRRVDVSRYFYCFIIFFYHEDILIWYRGFFFQKKTHFGWSETSFFNQWTFLIDIHISIGLLPAD